VGVTQLSAFTHVNGLVFYLDTSAVFPLALVAAGTTKPTELARAKLVTSFCTAAQKAMSRTLVSVLVFEEIAAKTRNEAQREVLRVEGHQTWRDFEAADKAKAHAERIKVQALMLAMLQHTATELGKLGVTVEQPQLQGTAAEAGKKLRKSHREFLAKYQSIDSMDALHIAFGAMLGCKHFVSFDKAWIGIAEIDLLN
jgi:hypothetical protein